MWNLLGNYPKTSLVMISDEAQLHPVVLGDAKTNGFVKPLQMPLFLRLKLLGQASVLLNEQYRMVAVICQCM